MNMQIASERIELFEHHRGYITDKIEALVKYAEILRMKEEAVMVKIVVESQKIRNGDEHIVIKVNMSVPHAMIRAEAAGKTIEEVTDLVVEKLKRQIDRYKEKHMHDMHTVSDELVADEPTMSNSADEMAASGKKYKITRRKLFSDLYPMDEQMAIEQMELLGHTFFIFVNERTNRYNLVYKRIGGNGYGLVELEQKDDVL